MGNDIRYAKDALRKKSKQLRSELAPEQKDSYDKLIADKFLNSTSYTKSSVILTYVSTPIEVDTTRIINEALSDGKLVACPRCIDNTRLMNFYYIDSLESLKRGSFGVSEPDEDKSRLFKGAARPICIVPGLAFDHWGYRLGYGKGYYDRFLSEYKGWTAGLCYSFCVEYKLPHGRFDRTVDRLFTEKIVCRCSQDRMSR